jgi:hypothetical protein
VAAWQIRLRPLTLRRVLETTAPTSTAGTIADGNVSEKPVAAPADWPEDWRIKLAGEDKSYLKTLDRFNTPSDLAKAYRDAQQRLSAGNLKAILPDNPTEEELKTWRTENGVPESPDKYDVNLGDGFVWSDEDKPLLDDSPHTRTKLTCQQIRLSRCLAGMPLFKSASRRQLKKLTIFFIKKAKISSGKNGWRVSSSIQMRLGKFVGCPFYARSQS